MLKKFTRMKSISLRFYNIEVIFAVICNRANIFNFFLSRPYNLENFILARRKSPTIK